MKATVTPHLEYNRITFDEDGFWDSEQFEDVLPIQFWEEEIPNQEYLDVLLKAWHDVDVDVTFILGDPQNFDAVAKRILHNNKYWIVRWSGNMSVREIRVLEDSEPLPFIIS